MRLRVYTVTLGTLCTAALCLAFRSLPLRSSIDAIGVGDTTVLTPSDFDRSKAPPVPPAKPMTFPVAQQRTLDNGTPVIVMEDHHLPIVSVTAVLELSPMLEPPGKTGLDGIVRAMLREGTATRNADQLADAFAELGNSVSPFGFSTITANVTPSLALMADQLLHPAFSEPALARIKANTVTDIQESKGDPGYLARHTFAAVVYGPTHPYAREATAQETMSMTRDDVLRFYTTYVRPPNVKFVVAGDMTPAQAVTALNRVFGAWSRGTSGHVDVPTPAGVSSTKIYLYDRPHSPQSVFLIGNIGPRYDSPDVYAIKLMNTTLGGQHTSRLVLNLREQHQYTYVVRSGFLFRRVPEVGTFSIRTSVITSKTDSALLQTMQELRGIRGSHPISPQEFSFATSKATAGLPLQFETVEQRASAVAQLVEDSLPLDYYNTLVPRYQSVTLSLDQAAATKYIDPEKLAIVIVGDRAMIEPKLRAAGIAPIVEVKPIP